MATSMTSLDQISPRSTDASSCSSLSPQEKRKDLSKAKAKSMHSFADLTFLKKISKAKFAVYLVQSQSERKKYALKAFPFHNDRPSVRYENETRFAALSHPNIVSMVQAKAEEETSSQGRTAKMSYIMMEYAPYGDFFDLVMNLGIEWEDKLIRTYFHHLIEGVEYLHSQGIAHLDLKLENLLVGAGFNMKIADFDLAHMSKDGKISTRGTRNYRAPELLNQVCEDPQAADVYSAAVILFVMKCEGVLPHLEDQLYKGINLCELLHNQPEIFWDKHCRIQKKSSSYFDKDFKSLFLSMTRYHPCERATISEIKRSKWYQGSIYSKSDLAAVMEDAWLLKNQKL